MTGTHECEQLARSHSLTRNRITYLLIANPTLNPLHHKADWSSDKTSLSNGVFTHTLGWDGLLTQCVKTSIEIHWVTSAADPIPSQPSVCVNAPWRRLFCVLINCCQADDVAGNAIYILHHCWCHPSSHCLCISNKTVTSKLVLAVAFLALQKWGVGMSRPT